MVGEIWSKLRKDWSPKLGDPRDPSEVDYAHVIHTGAFRRLHGKTQVLVSAAISMSCLEVDAGAGLAQHAARRGCGPVWKQRARRGPDV